VIWEPFLLALVLGLVVAAGLYFAYLWPAVEALDDDEPAAAAAAPSIAAAAPEAPAEAAAP
jgi:hypothetical protein